MPPNIETLALAVAHREAGAALVLARAHAQALASDIAWLDAYASELGVVAAASPTICVTTELARVSRCRAELAMHAARGHAATTSTVAAAAMYAATLHWVAHGDARGDADVVTAATAAAVAATAAAADFYAATAFYLSVVATTEHVACV
jgi:hypothetical protein